MQRLHSPVVQSCSDRARLPSLNQCICSVAIPPPHTLTWAPAVTHDSAVMGGRPCTRGLRITVGTIVGLIASGSCRQRILQAYPQLEAADIEEALADS